MKIKEKYLKLLNYYYDKNFNAWVKKIKDINDKIKYSIHIEFIVEHEPIVYVLFNNKIITDMSLNVKEEDNLDIDELELYIENIYKIF